jgi:hypothetical protein
LDFWFENKPSGNPEAGQELSLARVQAQNSQLCASQNKNNLIKNYANFSP